MHEHIVRVSKRVKMQKKKKKKKKKKKNMSPVVERLCASLDRTSKCRRLSEQPNDIQVATKSCNMKHIQFIGITLINLNHNRSTALFVIVIVGSIELILPKEARRSYRL